MKDIEKTIKEILETPFWPSGVETMKSYFRTHDDCDGDKSKGLSVIFSGDGDAHVSTTFPAYETCRFRTFGGGGCSLKVRNALLILAMAIKMEEEND